MSDLAGAATSPAHSQPVTRQPPHRGTTIGEEADLPRVFSLTVRVGLWAPGTL